MLIARLMKHDNYPGSDDLFLQDIYVSGTHLLTVLNYMNENKKRHMLLKSQTVVLAKIFSKKVKLKAIEMSTQSDRL